MYYTDFGRAHNLYIYGYIQYNENGRIYNVNNSVRFRGFPVVNNVIECGCIPIIIHKHLKILHNVRITVLI